jgi:putative ABC transport system permease protein
MMVQLAFRNAFLDSALEIIQSIDGDIIITSMTKFRFGTRDPISRRQFNAALGIEGVQWARPIYGEWLKSAWKSPQNQKIYNVQVLAFDPDQPVFLFPEVNARLDELRQPDTVFYDRRARRSLGSAPVGTSNVLARREIHIIGTFSLGPNFTTDATVITSDRTFTRLFAPQSLPEGGLAEVEFGVIRVASNYRIEDVQGALKRALPSGVSVRTKAELIAFETEFQNILSPVGPIFYLGVVMGFVVGMMISYQILYTDLSDQLPQFATLKAIGYEDGYLVRVVLQQSVFYGLVSFLPAWAAGVGLSYLIAEITLLPMRMSINIVLSTIVLTLGMCIASGVFAVKRVIAADPAELFR